ncbi:hypothetical protein GGX14DRAFT_397396 [Mycena pura]|uniref:Uncharacterized protein n=1 Tax=Mycena pura TaxID=153505 RepID=A0AAD6YAH2_9AGAR|nr:hypothetical protein GGX14DRAFT_397396 [Mycena pura]
MAIRRSRRNQPQETTAAARVPINKKKDSTEALNDSVLPSYGPLKVPLRRSRRNQPPETPAAAKVPVKKKKGSGEAVDDSVLIVVQIRTIPKRPRKGKMTENVAPEVPEDAGDSESEPVRKRARSAQRRAICVSGRPIANEPKNAKDVAKRNVPSSADADDVPSRQPDGADKGKITTGVTKQDVKDVEHRFYEDEKVQRDVDNEQYDNDDDEDDEDDDDYEQRDDDNDNEQRDDNDHQQGDVDADAQKHKRDVDGEEHANVDDDQQESNAQDKSRPSLFIHEEQESPPSRPVPLRLLWETHQATVHAGAGAHRLSDRLFEGVAPKLRHPKLNSEPNPYQVRADLAMQSFNRVLGLDAPSKAVPGLGGKSDNVSLGGSGHARSMLDSGGSATYKVGVSQNLWAVARRGNAECQGKPYIGSRECPRLLRVFSGYPDAEARGSILVIASKQYDGINPT